jgi:predicted permease
MTRLYRAILRLLPRDRRDRFGDEMARVFADQRRAATRAQALGLWMKEITGVMRFSLRELATRLRTWSRSRTPSPRWNPTAELRWAWRGIRARRLRAALVVVLLAVALAANTQLFSAADSLVFRRFPYKNIDRLVSFRSVSSRSTSPQPWSGTPAALDLLRARPELFSAVHGFLEGRYTFVMEADRASRERTSFVTPGLVEMLGGSPRWGRTLTPQDALDTKSRVALISETLSRERYGEPYRAVGRRLDTADEPLLIVGVMPRSFQFPDRRERIWRPLDYPRLHDGAMRVIGRLESGVSHSTVAAALAALSPGLSQSQDLPPDSILQPGALMNASATADQRRLLLMLLGAGLCLLLIACANVASLEVAEAMARARTFAIQAALGASRATLVRVALWEGACLAGAAVVLAAGLIWISRDSLSAWLPNRFIFYTANPIDLDWRAFLFMCVAATMSWLVASLPLVLFCSRRDPLGLLKHGGASTSRFGIRARQLLTMLETAVAVLLLVGGTLFVRTYVALLGVDNGFRSDHVARIGLTLPPAAFATAGATSNLRDRVLQRLRAHPDVKSVVPLYSNHFDEGTTENPVLEVDGNPAMIEPITLGMRTVDPAFFETLDLPLRRGRLLRNGEPGGNVVISDALAKHLWPNGEPIGGRFRRAGAPGETGWFSVVGVVGVVRHLNETPLQPGGRRHFDVYRAVQPAAPRPAAASAGIARPAVEIGPNPNVPGGPVFMFLTFAARLDAKSRLADIRRAVHDVENRVELDVAWIDGEYANGFADSLLAARVVSGFALFSFAVAAAGVYGVMTFLVAGRTREIGVRMALGAAQSAIGKWVLGESLRVVGAGAILGMAAAFMTSHWLESSLFGVRATDPWTYVFVVICVAVTATAATWRPALQAARIDPVITLRAE